MTIDDKTQLPLDKYLEDQKRLYERISRSLELYNRSILDAQRRAEEALEATAARQKQILESIRMPDLAMPDYASQIAEAAKAMERAISPVLEQIRQSFHELPPKMQAAILLLAEDGWYLDLDMPVPGIWELAETVAKGEVTEVEEALCEYYEERLPEIEKSISEKFPHRAHLIRAAFGAHRREEYILSIPVMLAQVDGICQDITKESIFMSDRSDHKKPRTAKYVARCAAAESFRAALLTPLSQKLPISASKSERVAGSDELYRHAVLHGEDLNYGTKKNGLKAVSLLNYIAQILGPENSKNRKKP